MRFNSLQVWWSHAATTGAAPSDGQRARAPDLDGESLGSARRTV